MSFIRRYWDLLKNRYKQPIGLQTLSLAVLICALDALLHLRFFILEVRQAVATLDSISAEGWIHALVFVTLVITAGLLYRVSNRWTSLTRENDQLHQSTEDIAIVRQSERQHISRYLHDTLSHNLAYLRLMLDYQAHSNQQAKAPGDLAEVERMLSVANESYEEVRNLLVNLREDAPSDLASRLQADADSVAERAGLDIDFIQTGQTWPISAYVTRQIMLIFREALHNVEKHAYASRVQIELNWTAERICLLIEDDGVGFQPVPDADRQGHHGLRIMKECAADINAQVVISPASPSGTCIELYLPQADNESKSAWTQPDISHIEILETETYRR